MRIYVDADACPVVALTEKAARDYNLPCTLVCDTAHELKSDYSQIVTIGQGADSADYKLLALVNAGDIVVTQDYGLAALVLSKRAYPINQNGLVYTDDNIDSLLNSRYIGAKIRRAGGRTKGPSKRTSEQNRAFDKSIRALIEKLIGC